MQNIRNQEAQRKQQAEVLDFLKSDDAIQRPSQKNSPPVPRTSKKSTRKPKLQQPKLQKPELQQPKLQEPTKRKWTTEQNFAAIKRNFPGKLESSIHTSYVRKDSANSIDLVAGPSEMPYERFVQLRSINNREEALCRAQEIGLKKAIDELE